MKVILNKHIALRGFWQKPYVCYDFYRNSISRLTEEEFNVLMKCDGKHEIENSDLLKCLIFEKRLCSPIKDTNIQLDEWQEYHLFTNPYFRSIGLQITGKCNYNCLHCFNAKDNAPLNTELSFLEVVDLLDQAKDCGIQSFMITGGEPLIHPRFLDICKEIDKRHMIVDEINTNGYFINQSLLDELKKLAIRPSLKISFDGVGFHDWLRNHKGAEEKTLEAIKLSVKNNFHVTVTMNINRHNRSSIFPTIRLLNEIGVHCIRFVPTVETLRWEANSNGKTFTIGEYFDAAMEITQDWAKNEYKSSLVIWQLLSIYGNYVTLYPLHKIIEARCATKPVCQVSRDEVSIAANGNLYPCFQCSSVFDRDHIDLGNIKKERLKNLLQFDANYLKLVGQSLKDRYEYCKKCHDCKFYDVCWGGCPVLAYKEHSSYISNCDINCYFYKNEYFEKFLSLFDKNKYRFAVKMVKKTPKK